MTMRTFVFGLFAVMVLIAPAMAVPSVDYKLFVPDPVNQPGRIRVDVTYVSDTPAERLTMLQIFVVEEPFGVITGPTGDDYSRFTFTDGASIAGWDPVIRQEISLGGVLLRTVFAPDAATEGLAAGTTTIGFIDIDFAGLVSGSSQQIKLGLLGDSLGTIGGFHTDPLNDASSDLVLGGDVANSTTVIITVPQQQQAVIPEPTTVGLAWMALSVAGLSRRWHGRR